MAKAPSNPQCKITFKTSVSAAVHSQSHLLSCHHHCLNCHLFLALIVIIDNFETSTVEFIQLSSEDRLVIYTILHRIVPIVLYCACCTYQYIDSTDSILYVGCKIRRHISQSGNFVRTCLDPYTWWKESHHVGQSRWDIFLDQEECFYCITGHKYCITYM